MKENPETSSSRSRGLALSLFVARLAMGASMIGLGLRLFVGGGWGAWNTTGVVLPTTYPRGPVGEILLNFWGNQFVIQLLIWSSVLIGIALVLGAAVRLASYGGMVIMLMFYLSVIPPGSVIISQQIIYLIMFAILAIGEAGKIGGLDSLLAPVLVERYPKLKYLLG
ncbi:hypothetical protein KGY58_00415 [Candidatus Bipolaricaulota bacterium]|nr:hypothetical protein [Candidatus Bipolaricaulota bacterium]